MKPTGTCPKCRCAELLYIPGPTDGGVFDNSLRAGATIFSAVAVNRYVCCGCGYTEEWVDPEQIPKLHRRYQAAHR